MSRGSGRRVVKALDSPQTSKGCIMRSSLISFFFFFWTSWTARPTHCRCSECVCVNCRMFGSAVSHSRGYFGLQWVEFRWCILWLKHKPFTHNDVFESHWWCVLLKPNFSVAALRVCVSLLQKRKEIINHLEHILQAFGISGFHHLEHRRKWRMLSRLNSFSFEPRHAHTHTYTHTTCSLVHDWVFCCVYMLLFEIGEY